MQGTTSQRITTGTRAAAPAGAPGNCSVSTGGACGKADFYNSCNPGPNKMCYCVGPYTYWEGLDWGTIETGDLACGATCDGKNGGTHTAPECLNPYECPVITLPTPTPTDVPVPTATPNPQFCSEPCSWDNTQEAPEKCSTSQQRQVQTCTGGGNAVQCAERCVDKPTDRPLPTPTTPPPGECSEPCSWTPNPGGNGSCPANHTRTEVKICTGSTRSVTCDERCVRNPTNPPVRTPTPSPTRPPVVPTATPVPAMKCLNFVIDGSLKSKTLIKGQDANLTLTVQNPNNTNCAAVMFNRGNLVNNVPASAKPALVSPAGYSVMSYNSQQTAALFNATPGTIANSVLTCSFKVNYDQLFQQQLLHVHQHQLVHQLLSHLSQQLQHLHQHQQCLQHQLLHQHQVIHLCQHLHLYQQIHHYHKTHHYQV